MKVFRVTEEEEGDKVKIIEKDVDKKHSQNTVLLPNKDFGKRKFLHVGLNPKPSPGKQGKTKSLSDIEDTGGLNETSLPLEAMRAANKQWVHPPEALLRGHIVYNVKFLGESEVESPKGTDIVRDAIRKRKFNKHIQKAEGQKTPRVELTISADGVTIQDPKTKVIKHQYPLHRISYCADDKTDKRMFTFIAKTGDSNQHYCYVFDSEKCSEEITLTIGQAFDLAYRRFLETSGKDLDIKKQYLNLQKKYQALEEENQNLKRRIKELEKLKDKDQLSQMESKPEINEPIRIVPGSVTEGLYVEPSSPLDESSTDEPVIGRRLENLFSDPSPVYNNVTSPTKNGTVTNGSTVGSPGPLLSPPPPIARSRTHGNTSTTATPVKHSNGHAASADLFDIGTSPAPTSVDPFGMPEFKPDTPQSRSAVKSSEQELMDIQAGFSAGLSFGTEDFSLEDFDPLNNK